MTNNPFELLEQALSQVDASADAFDPAAFGTGGWPMNPLLPPGFEDGTVPTPTVGSKQAIRSLYTAIQAIDDGVIAGSPDLQNTLLGLLGVENGHAPGGEEFESFLLGSYVLWLHSMGQLLVESYSVAILAQDLVTDAHRGTPETQQWLWQLSQADREQLLKRCTDLEDGVTDEMTTARRQRNELLTSLGQWEGVDHETPVADARRYLEILDALDDRVPQTGSFDFLSPVEG